MKSRAPILLLIFLTAFTGCLEPAKSDRSTQSSQQIEKPSSAPIFEMMEDAQGMWAIVGKTLFFRFYENGAVEFEYPDNNKRIQLRTRNAAEVNTMIRVKLDEVESQKLFDLINAKDFQKISNKYKRECCCTDASLSYNISFKDAEKTKVVNLIGYCALSELTSSQDKKALVIPKALSDLIILIDYHRSKHNPFTKSSNETQ